MTRPSLRQSYTAQVAQHDSRESAWFVHNGKVIDGTKFLEEHPGGAESIMMVAGEVGYLC